MLLISLLIYVLLTFVISTVLYERITLSKWLITFFFSVYASNVFILEILSLLGIANQPIIFIGSQALFCVMIIFLLKGKQLFSKKIFSEKVASFFVGWRWVDYVLAGLMSCVFSGFFYVGITTPPNNMDTLHTHLTRIYYWLQHGSFAYWNASSSSHLNYPINGHIQGLWLFMLGRNENLFFLVQWFSLIIVIAAIYEIARSLEFSSTQALFSGVIALSFPIILLQTYSFQGDLSVAALGMACIALLLNTLISKKVFVFLAAMLALLLAIGTKQTAFFIAPVIGFYVICWLIKNRKQVRFIPIIGICFALFICFSSYQYVQNYVNTGSVFGVDDALGSDYVNTSNFGQKAVYILPRYLYQFIGVDGIPRYMQPSILKTEAKIFRKFLDPLNINLEDAVYMQAGASDDEQFYYERPPILSEDNAWFGPIAFPLVTLSLIIVLFSRKKLRRQYVVFAILLNLVYVFFILLQRPGWDPYQGRYFMLGFLPMVPLTGILLPNQRIAKSLLLIIIIPLSLFLSFNTLCTNIYKPTINANTIYKIQNQYILTLPENSKPQVIFKNYLVKISNRIGEAGDSRRSIQTLDYLEQLFTGSKVIGTDIAFIEKYISEDTPLYFTIQRSAIEYGLFGRNKTRELFPVDDISEVSNGYYLVSSDTPVDLSGKVEFIAKNKDYCIYYVNP